MKLKRKWKWLGDDYDEFKFAEPTNKKEELKLNIWFLVIVFLPLMILMLIRYVLGFGINLAD